MLLACSVAVYAGAQKITLVDDDGNLANAEGGIHANANGPFEGIPIFGEYKVTIEDGDGKTSAPFVIGVLKDYPKDAPEMLYPEHDQAIAEIQPTFRWEE